jgi:hypothetical protein
VTTNFTQFVNILVQAFTDYVTDYDTSTYAAQMNSQIRYNVQRRKIEEITLNNGQSYQLSLASLSTSDWHFLAVTCMGASPATVANAGITQAAAGQGYISTAGKAADNMTAITGKTPLYGVTLPSGIIFPGVAFLSTYNLTAAPTIVSQLDGSIFQVYACLCVEDGA